MVNEELWNEARTYEDIQLMPFVDYYNLITWKTIAICIFGVKLSYLASSWRLFCQYLIALILFNRLRLFRQSLL